MQMTEAPMPVDDEVTAIGALADDARRALYRYVIAQPGPVGRGQAAAALDMPTHRARFHLEKLEQAGLLETDYARPTGRSGPGAGRPAKRYRRAARDVAVSLPPRHYDLAGSLLATAIEATAATGEPIAEAVARVAAEHGRDLAAAACSGSGSAGGLDAVEAVLEAQGYEPRETERGTELRNCPFHRLSREHTALVCGMNAALLGGVVDAAAPGAGQARLDPAAGRCCVIIESDASVD